MKIIAGKLLDGFDDIFVRVACCGCIYKNKANTEVLALLRYSVMRVKFSMR